MTSDAIPSTLDRPGAAPFWFAVLLTGVGTGVAAAALTRLLELVQRHGMGWQRHEFAGICPAG
jgi:CIC family chloride channel protein